MRRDIVDVEPVGQKEVFENPKGEGDDHKIGKDRSLGAERKVHSTRSSRQRACDHPVNRVYEDEPEEEVSDVSHRERQKGEGRRQSA